MSDMILTNPVTITTVNRRYIKHGPESKCTFNYTFLDLRLCFSIKHSQNLTEGNECHPPHGSRTINKL